MHSDDRWLSAGERRHVSKADPWLDGLGLDLPQLPERQRFTLLSLFAHPRI